MAANERYRQQVALLVRALPAVAGEDCFALKGGTAINLSSGGIWPLTQSGSN